LDNAVKDALEVVHAALDADNQGIDEAIASLKAALASAGQTQVTMDATRLPQSNRQGRKLLQSYFRKRGVTVVFD
jgi:hypothetical protein